MSGLLTQLQGADRQRRRIRWFVAASLFLGPPFLGPLADSGRFRDAVAQEVAQTPPPAIQGGEATREVPGPLATFPDHDFPDHAADTPARGPLHADRMTPADPNAFGINPSGVTASGEDGADVSLPGETPGTASGIPPLNLLALLLKGRWLMLPIAIMSVLVVMIAIERLFAMRRGRVMPARLVEGLNTLGGVPGVMDPRRAYRLCQQYPSPAAVVIRSMLLKIGRPHSEVEHAVKETSEREAERLYGSARWLNLIAAVAPLTGLLGTVWGMIRAFYDTTHLPLGQNKAEYLAEGIYVALVTTLGGLVVAIPAAIFAHYFEGRVVALFHQIDELLFSLMPQVERYEGRVRVTPHSLGSADEEAGGRAAEAEVPVSDPLPSTATPNPGSKTAVRQREIPSGRDSDSL